MVNLVKKHLKTQIFQLSFKMHYKLSKVISKKLFQYCLYNHLIFSRLTPNHDFFSSIIVIKKNIIIQLFTMSFKKMILLSYIISLSGAGFRFVIKFTITLHYLPFSFTDNPLIIIFPVNAPGKIEKTERAIIAKNKRNWVILPFFRIVFLSNFLKNKSSSISSSRDQSRLARFFIKPY